MKRSKTHVTEGIYHRTLMATNQYLILCSMVKVERFFSKIVEKTEMDSLPPLFSIELKSNQKNKQHKDLKGREIKKKEAKESRLWKTLNFI